MASGRPNILWHEPRMIGNDRFWRQASSQLAKYDLNRHPRPSDHRLSAHDFGIDLDSLVPGHG
jgi:hypothetical protein